MFKIAESITERDDSGVITKSAVALGEFQNVLHAKEILGAMIMQAGGDIISVRADTGSLETHLAKANQRHYRLMKTLQV